MWFPKFILLISLFGYFESFAGPKNVNGIVYRHVIQVTEFEKDRPSPTSIKEDETMVSKDLKITHRTL